MKWQSKRKLSFGIQQTVFLGTQFAFPSMAMARNTGSATVGNEAQNPIEAVCGAPTDLDKLFQDYLENEVLEHSEVVQAVRVGHPIPTRIPLRNELATSKSVKEILTALAYSPESEDPNRKTHESCWEYRKRKVRSRLTR